MRNQFADYNLSLKLNEKGFNEPCFGYYFRGDFYFSESKGGKLIQYSHSEEQVIQAPLWQQVIEWFETRGVYISIKYAAPDTNKFHFRLDNYNPVYKVCQTYIDENDEIITIPTGEMVGQFAICPKEWYGKRIECMIAAIEHALNLI